MKAENVAEYLSADRLNPDYASAIRALIAERDALRALLAAARAHLLGDGHGYDSAVVVAIDVELEIKP